MSSHGFVSMLSLSDLYFITETAEGYSYRFQWSTQAVKATVDGVFDPDIYDYVDEDDGDIDSDYYITKALYDYVSANKYDGTDQADSFIFRIYDKETGTLIKEISTSETSVDVDGLAYGGEYLWEVAALKNGQIIKTSDKLYFCSWHNSCNLPGGANGQADGYSDSEIYNASSENHLMRQTGHSGHIQQGVITSYGSSYANFFVCGESWSGPRNGYVPYKAAQKGGYLFSISNSVGGIGDDFPTTENCLFTQCGIYVFNDGKWDYLAYNAKTNNAKRCQSGDFFALDNDHVTEKASCTLYRYNSATGEIETVVTASSAVVLISPSGTYYQTYDGIYQTGSNKKVASVKIDYGEYDLFDDMAVNVYCLYENTRKTDDLELGESGSLKISYIPLDGATAGKTQTFTIYETGNAPAEVEADDDLLVFRIGKYICYQLNLRSEYRSFEQGIVVIHVIGDGKIVDTITRTYDSAIYCYINERGDIVAEYWNDDAYEDDIIVAKAVVPVISENQYFWEWPEDSLNGRKQTVSITSASGTLYLELEPDETGIDLYGIAPGTYRCRRSDSTLTEPEDLVFSVTSSGDPAHYAPQANGKTDLFFGNADGIWGSGFAARYDAELYSSSAACSRVVLAGKNRISDMYSGSSDANILVLTDDANGDALFVDDIFTGLPGNESVQQSRVSMIGEIRAGAGNDIIDLTSSRFASGCAEMTIRGGAGDDVIWATGEDNDLFGDSGDDRIVGSTGFDMIAGGEGNDIMHSGGGDDIFAFCENWGEDIVEITGDSRITLWFASGNESKWDPHTRIYRDGNNSVTVIGGETSVIELKFGDEGGQYNDMVDTGAFKESSCEKIFENEAVGFLA